MDKVSDVLKKAEWLDYKNASVAERKYEDNDGISQTVQSDWIPIGEQVRMIMKGEITIGNLDDGYDETFNDLEKESPDEVFEDATDYGTEYSDELRDAVLTAGESKQANDSAETETINENDDVEATKEATTE